MLYHLVLGNGKFSCDFLLIYEKPGSVASKCVILSMKAFFTSKMGVLPFYHIKDTQVSSCKDTQGHVYEARTRVPGIQ